MSVETVQIPHSELTTCVMVKHPELRTVGFADDDPRGDVWVYVTGLIVMDENEILVQGQEVGPFGILGGSAHFVEFTARVGQLLEAM